jgi:hypothetical protein
LTPDWIGAAIRLNTVASGVVDPLWLSADLNDDQSIRGLKRFRAVADAVAARIVFVLGPGARALWRLAFDTGAPRAVGAEGAATGPWSTPTSGGRR